MSTLARVVGESGDSGAALSHTVHYAVIVVGLAGVLLIGLVQRSRQPVPVAERLVVPLALVSSTAAAGVHAAMAPPHLRESVLFGVFFAMVAVLQLAWAGLLMVRPSRALLVLGALGNVAVLVLWAVTRTIGLPLGLLPEPEAVGAWDLASATWELVVAACCVALLRSSRARTQVALWRDWPGSVRVYTGGSVLLLAAMTVSGSVA